MRIAIPLANGRLAMHFGHCERFALIDVDPETRRIVSKSEVVPPPHQPGLLPPWLASQGVDLVITGGMGGRAQRLFAESGIETLVGAAVDEPEAIVDAYLSGRLTLAANPCDH